MAKVKRIFILIVIGFILLGCKSNQHPNPELKRSYIIQIKHDSLPNISIIYCDSFNMIDKNSIDFYVNGQKMTIVSDIIVPKTNIKK